MSTIKKLEAKKEGKVVGSVELDWPDNLKEALELTSEVEVFKCYEKGRVLIERAKLYPNAGGGKTVAKKDIYDRLIAAGMPQETAVEISEYDPNAEVAAA